MGGSTGHAASTHREYLKYSGAAVGGGLIAGCTGDGVPGTASTPTGTENGTTTPDSAYSLSMEPVGTVELDRVPETLVQYTGEYADMGVALGQADGLQAVQNDCVSYGGSPIGGRLSTSFNSSKPLKGATRTSSETNRCSTDSGSQPS
ncbi:hypothetical protein C479_06437 [Halovivax asiaticus JCM 14624]|uniref:Uncharacterized protein n=1 Tax=Halovivax asiaticus JCM 14624 TaxID=1227490 RepID=M0BLA8_9EURY|nr:hypothetical protein [Halovivax asiaticus]ELZ11671.1 hypothetical protein C479_06437 [Halovivax asiaticus JCM 14624]